MTIADKILSGEIPTPNSAKTLGFEFISYDSDRLEAHVAFLGIKDFTNSAGNIQGGFLCAMLDDVMGPALIFSLKGNQFAPTLELKTQFLHPVKPGRIEGKGRVIAKGRKVCFIEAELYKDEKIVAKATATALILAKNS